MIDALVTGRSLPALLVALDLAEVGLRVAVAGGPVEVPGAPERDPEGAVEGFLTRIAAPIEAGLDAAHGAGSAAAPLRRAPSPIWLPDRAGRWAPLSSPSSFGIPAVPLASENARLMGSGTATRAYLDRLQPLLTIGKTRTIGELVRRRMGRTVLERLVDPLVRERFGVAASEVDVAIAAPGLNEALSRAGSLSGAVLANADRHEARESTIEPVGGWKALTAALLARLSSYGVELPNPGVVEIEPEDEHWRVALEGPSGPSITARAVVLDGVGRQPAERLLESLAPRLIPRDYRAYAEIDIQAPEELDPEASAIRTLGEWSLRVDPERDGGVRRAHFAGPAIERGSGGLERIRAAELAGDLTPGLAAAGLEPVPSAEWEIDYRVAPFSTLEDRHRAEEALAELAEADVGAPLLAVGRELHGDSLSQALESAHLGSVALRRRLLGLTE